MNQKHQEIVEICKNCRFHDTVGTANLCYCRRYAPRAGFNHGVTCTDWPKVLDDNWCGEFEPYPEEG